MTNPEPTSTVDTRTNLDRLKQNLIDRQGQINERIAACTVERERVNAEVRDLRDELAVVTRLLNNFEAKSRKPKPATEELPLDAAAPTPIRRPRRAK